MKKAVFLDIDGTIWDRTRMIPASTKRALYALHARGHLSFLCSGRARGHIYDERLLSLPVDGIIAGCGTHIEAEGKILYERYLPWDVMQHAFRILREEHMPYILEGVTYHWMNPEEFTLDAEDGNYVRRLQKELGGRARRLDALKEGDQVNKLSAVVMPDSDFSRVKRELGHAYDFLDHNGRVVEMIAKGTGKATGIEKACALFGIDRADTYAVGDSVNDLDMFQYVAHGICMGNGTDVAKKAAEYVTTPLQEDGIWNAFVHYGLIEEEGRETSP